jgi:hypothetical protein
MRKLTLEEFEEKVDYEIRLFLTIPCLESFDMHLEECFLSQLEWLFDYGVKHGFIKEAEK